MISNQIIIGIFGRKKHIKVRENIIKVRNSMENSNSELVKERISEVEIGSE